MVTVRIWEKEDRSKVRSMLGYIIQSYVCVRVCISYLSAVVVLGHTVLLVDEEGMEDVEVEERGPSCQHQSVFSDVQNQRARRRLQGRQVHPAETPLH